MSCRTDRRSISSSSDEVLQVISNKKQEKDLYACQVITCEFCDEAFWNKYTHLVHNANHIIIPLIRKTYFKCQECQLQCRTDRKLRKHMKKRHPDITRKHRKKKIDSTDSDSLVESAIDIRKNDNLYEEYENSNKVYHTLDSNKEYESSNDVRNDSNENGNSNKEYDYSNNVNLIKEYNSSIAEMEMEKEEEFLKTDTNISEESVFTNGNSNIGVEIIEIESDEDETEDKKDFKKECEVEKVKIQNRLIFEDEDDIIEPNGLVNDLMADIKVSVDLEPWMSSIADQKTQEEQPGKETKSEGKKENENEEEWRSKTVSYQELMMSVEEVACKYCNETFYNRLFKIMHESSHIIPKRRHPFLCQYCDWYVSDNPAGLRKHQIRNHSNMDVRQNAQRKKCEICKLKFVSKQKHMQNYHNIEEEEGKTQKPHFQKRVMKVCDLCSSFLKDVHNNVHYRTVGEESVYGERQTCERCFKQYFNINLVEITSRLIKVVNPFKKVKTISNVDRLKNFKNRLKMMNTIRKYCFLFYLSFPNDLINFPL